jgi:hypothetical protein
VPNASADRISSNVWPAAPFIVMPSAMEALSGDMKMFESARPVELAKQVEPEGVARANDRLFAARQRAAAAR